MWEPCHYLALLAQWVKDDSLRIKCKQSQFYQNNKSRFLKLESVCWILVLLCTMNNTQHAHYKIWLCLHQSVGQNASAGQYASVYTSTYLHCEVKFYRNIAEAHGARSRLVELQATNFLFLCIASVQNKKNQISGKSRWNVWLELKLSNPSSGGRAGQAGGHDTHSGQGEFQLAGGPQL